VHSFGRRRRSTNSTLDTDEESEPEVDTNVATSKSSSTQGPLDQPSSSKSYEAENTTVNIANMSQSEEVENEKDPGDVYAKVAVCCY
jgi:hypothetical protein